MKSYQGKRCLDLSMGLGVDSLHFSHHFEEVISVEMRSDLHLIGKHNFSQLGIQNIRLVHARAEEYLSQYQGPAFDLIYIDPARRDDQDNRIHDLAACSPNIFELWPFLSTHGRKIVVKASPLYDINEGLQKIPNCRKIYIHSAKNEVREVTFEAEGDIESSEVVDLEVVVDNGQKFFRYTFPLKGKENLKSESENITASILLEADVAFYKGRCFSQLMGRYFPAVSGRFTHPMGFFLTEGAQVEDFPGRQFSIKEVFEYKPRLLKRELKKRGMKTIHVIQRNFFQSVANIRQQLSLKEGGRMYLICTEVDGQSKAFLCERLS
ncbi:MAG: RsmD family RNA methyltransferase [Bacteroidota bacterium]